jgi:FKBP-type peptidyl-prolyl cis-trans isomerase
MTQGTLEIDNLRAGTGAEARAGSTVTVHYVGTLTNGTKFDSSRDRGKGFSFKLGAGMVIKGWDQGVAGMKVGEMRKLTIPPDLAYGERGFPPVIPPNSTLVFEVELLSVA